MRTSSICYILTIFMLVLFIDNSFSIFVFRRLPLAIYAGGGCIPLSAKPNNYMQAHSWAEILLN